MHANFLTWFESLQEEQLTALAIKEFRASADKLTPEEQKTHLKDLITDIYRKTLGYRHKRLKLEGQITRLYFDGSPAIEADKPIWRELIVLERENGYV